MPQAKTDLPVTARTWYVPAENGYVSYGDIHEIMHRDIKLGNGFRKERIKHMATLAGGVFAITVTFHKELFGGRFTEVTLSLVLAGWALLLVSLAAGIFHFRAWENFYLAHRGTSNAVWARKVADLMEHPDREEAIMQAEHGFAVARRQIRKYQRGFGTWDLIQSIPLLLGMACIAAYVAISPPASPASGTLANEPERPAVQP